MVTRGAEMGLEIYEVGDPLDQPVASYPWPSSMGMTSEMAVSGDGKFLAVTSGFSGRVLCWDFEEEQLVDVSHDEEALEELRTQQGRRSARTSRPDRVWDLAFAPNSTWLAGGHHKGVTIWDVVSKTVVAELPLDQRVFAVAFSPDGRSKHSLIQR